MLKLMQSWEERYVVAMWVCDAIVGFIGRCADAHQCFRMPRWMGRWVCSFREGFCFSTWPIVKKVSLKLPCLHSRKETMSS